MSNHGLLIWAVGGAVRDKLLGKEPKDIDFAHNGTPEQVQEIAKTAGLYLIPDQTALSHGITRFADPDTKQPIDLAVLRKDVSCDGRHAQVEWTKDIVEDLARRDFTVNAMAAKINEHGETGPIIDPFGGQRDLESRTISFVGNPNDRIKEDYLRILRACRFTALGEGWKIDNDSDWYMRQHVEWVISCSKERIRDELVKGIMYPKPSNMFRSMQSIGLLVLVFPDLAKGVGVTQNEHHAEPVFDHLVRVLDCSVELTDNPLLRLACLTHDIAKPHTREVQADGSVTFYKHEVVGASLMYDWMRALRFSKKEVEYVVNMVRNHQWHFETDSKEKTIRKWLQSVGKTEWRDLITLRMADRKGNLKKANKPQVTKEMKELITRAEAIIASGAPIFKEDLAITGEDLKELGIKPGPVYKDIFNNILGIVVTDPEKNTKDWLSNYVCKNYLKNEKDVLKLQGNKTKE